MDQISKQDIVQELRARILKIQGSGKHGNNYKPLGLGDIETAFPDGVFPTGAIHEFISPGPETAAATSGFLSCILHRLLRQKGYCLWVSSRRIVFPPALKLLGIDPEWVIFVDLAKDKDVLWVVEEALRCKSLIAVVGELQELTFAQSRRLQLTIEESGVTGFIHRTGHKSEHTTACTARWKVNPLPGIVESGMPGVGFPKWHIELTKVRNGKPGSWELGWTPAGFELFIKSTSDANNKTEDAKYA